MGFIVFPGALPDDWLNLCQRQNLANWDLRFVPFEDENAVWSPDPESLSKPGAQVVAPCVFVQPPVLFPHLRIVTNTLKVRRIEHDNREGVVSEWLRTEVSDQVRADYQPTTVTQLMLFIADIVSEIQLGQFDYAQRFPESKAIKKFTSTRVAHTWGQLVELWMNAKEEDVSRNTMGRIKAQLKTMSRIIGDMTLIADITHSDMMG